MEARLGLISEDLSEVESLSLIDRAEQYEREGDYEKAREYYLRNIFEFQKINPAKGNFYGVYTDYRGLARTYDMQTLECTLFNYFAEIFDYDYDCPINAAEKISFTYQELSKKIDAFLLSLKSLDDFHKAEALLVGLNGLLAWYDCEKETYFQGKGNKHLFGFIDEVSVCRLKRDIEKIHSTQKKLTDVGELQETVNTLTEKVKTLEEKIARLEKGEAKIKLKLGSDIYHQVDDARKRTDEPSVLASTDGSLTPSRGRGRGFLS